MHASQQIQTTDADAERDGGILELVNTQQINGENTRDFELIKEACSGSSSAFKDLFDTHVNRIYAVCLRYSQDADTADELTQEVFIKAWEKLHTFQFESKFSSWLYSIATNQFLMHKRS